MLVNHEEMGLLLAAGFTMREISAMQRKFYNLFNVVGQPADRMLFQRMHEDKPPAAWMVLDGGGHLVGLLVSRAEAAVLNKTARGTVHALYADKGYEK